MTVRPNPGWSCEDCQRHCLVDDHYWRAVQEAAVEHSLSDGMSWTVVAVAHCQSSTAMGTWQSVIRAGFPGRSRHACVAGSSHCPCRIRRLNGAYSTEEDHSPEISSLPVQEMVLNVLRCFLGTILHRGASLGPCSALGSLLFALRPPR